MEPIHVGILAGGLIVGFLACYAWFRALHKETFRKRDEVIAESKTEAEKVLAQAKESSHRDRREAEKELTDRRGELRQLERRVLKKEDAMEARAGDIQKRERHIESMRTSIEKKEQGIQTRDRELQQIIEEEKRTLHKVAGLSKEEAVKMLIEKMEPELEREKADLIEKRMAVAKDNAETEAKRIISMAIHRFASGHTADSVVTVVDLPNEEMKGRIIGREGRNIRAFERATGVDVIVDDTPGVIVLSCFDGVRREMARRSMEKLVFDGRIHPTRIEEVTELAKREMEEHINQIGKQFLHEQDVHNVHPKLVTLLGRLKYRTSFGQNVLQHVKEVAHLCSVMSAELNMDPKIGRRCGLFHDIGKAVDQDFEGSHPVIGGELLKRFNESKEVIDAAASHHNDPDAKFPYTIIAAAADAISASRPGARGESLDRYVKRLEALEALATAKEGVTGAYAIQAGREVRILVDSEKINDDQALIVAREIANDIERELTYPGEIKVTVLRETRVIEYAR